MAESTVADREKRNEYEDCPFPPTQCTPRISFVRKMPCVDKRVNTTRKGTRARLNFLKSRSKNSLREFLFAIMTPGGTEIYLGRLRRLGQRGTDSVKSAWLDTRTYQPVAFSVLGILILALTIGPLIAQNASPFDETQDRKEEINDLVRRRAQWYFQQRRSAQGHVPGSLRLQALAENEKRISTEGTFADRVSMNGFAIAPNTNSWTSLGPAPTANTLFYGNVSGRVTAVASDPCDATGNTVYVGAADGGVWVTFNALSQTAVSWKPLTDDQPSLDRRAGIGQLILPNDQRTESEQCHFCRYRGIQLRSRQSIRRGRPSIGGWWTNLAA